MQEVYKDGSLGEVKTADILEDLLPMIKKSLAKSEVKYVKIFNAPDGSKVQANEHLKDLKELVTEDEEKMKSPFRTFPRKRI